MTPSRRVTPAELEALIARARQVAEPVGPMHALWDAIFDGESWLRGEPTLLNGDRDEVLAAIVESLRKAK